MRVMAPLFLWGSIAVACCLAQGFPLTLVGETAYTLAKGQLLIGTLRLPTTELDIMDTEIHYGITDSLQVGTKPLLFLGGFLNAEFKQLVNSGTTLFAWGGGIAIPPDLSYVGVKLSSWMSFVSQPSWHLGAEVAFSPNVAVQADLAAELRLFPWFSLLGELAMPPPGGYVGTVVRLGEFLLLRAVVGAVVEEGLGFRSYLELLALLSLF